MEDETQDAGLETPTARAVRLVQVSDIHFGAEDPAALAGVAAFMERVRPDALIVAGDLTQDGRRREFLAARAWLDSLSVPCIVAPGNHDTPALHLPLRLHTRFLAPFELYERHLGDYDGVGRLFELGGGKVRLSALNTARGVQGRLNWSDGVIRLEDLDDALAQLAQGATQAWRILVCHHPLREPGHSRISVDTRRGGEALKRCADRGVDAILTGHIHDAFAHPLRIAGRRMVQLGSGTLSTRLRATPPSFCLIAIDGDRLTQDVIHVEGAGLTVHRNYDSRLHESDDLRRVGFG